MFSSIQSQPGTRPSDSLPDQWVELFFPPYPEGQLSEGHDLMQGSSFQPPPSLVPRLCLLSLSERSNPAVVLWSLVTFLDLLAAPFLPHHGCQTHLGSCFVSFVFRISWSFPSFLESAARYHKYQVFIFNIFKTNIGIFWSLFLFWMVSSDT